MCETYVGQRDLELPVKKDKSWESRWHVNMERK